MSDMEREVDLGPLDPATEDPAYWDRFQEKTVARAWPLLERRALQRTPRLGLQLVSWGRMVAPAAALAAAFAGLVLVSDTPELETATGPMTEIEEIMNQELHRAGLPAHFSAGTKVRLEAFVMAIQDVDGEDW